MSKETLRIAKGLSKINIPELPKEHYIAIEYADRVIEEWRENLDIDEPRSLKDLLVTYFQEALTTY